MAVCRPFFVCLSRDSNPKGSERRKSARGTFAVRSGDTALPQAGRRVLPAAMSLMAHHPRIRMNTGFFGILRLFYFSVFNVITSKNTQQIVKMQVKMQVKNKHETREHSVNSEYSLTCQQQEPMAYILASSSAFCFEILLRLRCSDLAIQTAA